MPWQVELFQVPKFRQVANLWFQKKKETPKEEQHTYVILWSGVEGLRMFNTWKMTEEVLSDPKNVWEAFSTKLEPRIIFGSIYWSSRGIDRGHQRLFMNLF